MAHTGGPVDSSSVCIAPTFLSSCAIWLVAANIVHIFCAYTQRSLRSSISVLRWKSIKMCGRLLPPLSGITLIARATHSLHYTPPSSSMMTRSPRLCIHWFPPRRLTALRPQALRSVHSCHTAPSAHLFLQGPSEAMPTSLAETITQLLFLEFLQRCGIPIALPQPSHLPVPISLLDAVVQTNGLHPVTPLRMCPRRHPISLAPRLFFDVAVSVQTSSLDAAVQTLPQKYSGRFCADGFSLEDTRHRPIRLRPILVYST